MQSVSVCGSLCESCSVALTSWWKFWLVIKNSQSRGDTSSTSIVKVIRWGADGFCFLSLECWLTKKLRFLASFFGTYWVERKGIFIQSITHHYSYSFVYPPHHWGVCYIWSEKRGGGLLKLKVEISIWKPGFFFCCCKNSLWLPIMSSCVLKVKLLLLLENMFLFSDLLWHSEDASSYFCSGSRPYFISRRMAVGAV